MKNSLISLQFLLNAVLYFFLVSLVQYQFGEQSEFCIALVIYSEFNKNNRVFDATSSQFYLSDSRRRPKTTTKIHYLIPVSSILPSRNFQKRKHMCSMKHTRTCYGKINRRSGIQYLQSSLQLGSRLRCRSYSLLRGLLALGLSRSQLVSALGFM